jgi:hypothetical protein
MTVFLIISNPVSIDQFVDAMTGDGRHVRATVLSRGEWVQIDSGSLCRVCSALSENGRTYVYVLPQ